MCQQDQDEDEDENKDPPPNMQTWRIVGNHSLMCASLKYQLGMTYGGKVGHRTHGSRPRFPRFICQAAKCECARTPLILLLPPLLNPCSTSNAHMSSARWQRTHSRAHPKVSHSLLADDLACRLLFDESYLEFIWEAQRNYANAFGLFDLVLR